MPDARFAFPLTRWAGSTLPPSTPKNKDLADSTPGSPQNLVLVFVGWKPDVDFALFAFSVVAGKISDFTIPLTSPAKS